MKTASLLLASILVCGAVGLSRSQTPSGEAVKPQANPEPTIPQVHRDIGKILSAQKNATAARSTSSSSSGDAFILKAPISTIQAGGQNFVPPTEDCYQAIARALNTETLVVAPDDKCADMMEDALDARLRTGQ